MLNIPSDTIEAGSIFEVGPGVVPSVDVVVGVCEFIATEEELEGSQDGSNDGELVSTKREVGINDVGERLVGDAEFV